MVTPLSTVRSAIPSPPALAVVLAALASASAASAQPFVTFEDVADEAGVRTWGTTFGVGFEDLDGDGLLDLFLAQTPSLMSEVYAIGGNNRLLWNDGAMTFTDGGADAGVDSPCEDRGLMIADYDNDGDVDVYVTVAGRNELYRNEGDGTFREVARQAGVDHPGIGHEGAWLDYDGDGLLDLFFTNGPKSGSLSNVLYHNEGDGRFLDVADEAGVRGTISGKGVALLDHDRDGWLDLLVINGEGYPDFALYANQGDGTFVDVADDAGLAVEYDTPSDTGIFLSWVIPWDHDGDGWTDLLVGSHSGQYHPHNAVFHNLGDGTFAEIAEQIGLRDPYNGDGTAIADLDNDGALDALFCRLDDECVLYRGVAGAPFEVLDGNAGLLNREEYPNWTVATGDLDGDGFLEVYLGNGRANHPASDRLFHNGGNDHHHLLVEVEGTRSDRSALGASIELVAGGRTQTRRVGARTTTFSSHGGLRQHFGLGDEAVVDELTVTFLSGEQVTLTDVAADQLLRVVEPLPDEQADGDRDGVPDLGDVCPWTPSLTATDARGCAAFEGGDGTEALAALSPDDLAVEADPPTFTWQGTLDGYVVQVDGDSAFDHDRVEFGPTDGTSWTLDGADVLELRARFPEGRLFWRVVGSTDEVVLATEARELGLPTWAVSVELLHGDLNLWDPPHPMVEAGTELHWRIATEAEGNYNKFRHDVLVTDEAGRVVGRSGLLRPFEQDNSYSFVFDEPGRYHVMCAMHSWSSGGVTDIEQLLETTIEPGPYRCHSGTVTVVAP